MRSSTKCLVAVLWLVGFSWTGAYAQDHPAKGASKPEPSKENLVQTRHALTLGGSKLEYEATAGPLVLKDEEGKPRANIFFVAYTRLPADNPTQRPITFLFNGGPGAAAVWLHLGAFGPRRIVLDEAGKTVAPPYHLTDNPTTLLDLTDLVFVDPVTTG
ncbi:MAG: peptidase S10, partial [Planctomycetes bacterium]|nr:peptidase S10 [Planctomycetota bacterium]